MTTQTTENTLINGIDVDALRGAIAAIAADPDKGQTSWKVRSQWKGGTRSDHTVDGFVIGGQKVDRDFTIRIDEPCELTGTNQYANPQEYLLSALNACMMVGYVAAASVHGVRLTKLEVETKGDIDLRGFLGIDPDVAPGYESLHYTVRIDGDGTPEQFQKIHDTVTRLSPNRWNIGQPIKLTSDLIVG